MAGESPREGSQEAQTARAERIARARGDFISSMGRRVAELRATLTGLEDDPKSGKLRDDLRRRIHALSAGSRLLRFEGMAAALADSERLLERATLDGIVQRSDAALLSATIESLPSLAWGEPTHAQRLTERPPPTSVLGEKVALPPTALVVGPSGLADALTHDIGQAGEPVMECERTEIPA